jgi:GNAT superfamily N-acetyltransferase
VAGWARRPRSWQPAPVPDRPSPDPAAFRRWHLGTADVVHDWSDEALTVCHVRTQRGDGLTVLADPAADDVPDRAAAAVADAVARLRASGVGRLRLAVPQSARGAVAGLTGTVDWSLWEWMHAHVPPPASPQRAGIGWLEDTDLPDVSRFLAEHSPRSHAAPGDPDVRGWAGARDGEGLTCVGAVVESRAGFPHLRAITTRSALRGQGLGGAVTSFLTAASLAHSHVVTLSLYSDNTVARRLYEGLGYTVGAAFASTALHLTS